MSASHRQAVLVRVTPRCDRRDRPHACLWLASLTLILTALCAASCHRPRPTAERVAAGARRGVGRRRRRAAARLGRAGPRGARSRPSVPRPVSRRPPAPSEVDAGRHDAPARAHRGALASLPAPVQRDPVGRSGAEGAARPSDRPRGGARRGDAPGRHHHRARPRHRGRARRRRAAPARHRAENRARPAPARGHPRHRRHRQLRAVADPLCLRPAAGRGGGRRRRRDHPGGPEPGRPRRRLDQGLRRLSAGDPAASSGRPSRSTSSRSWSRPRAAPGGRWRPTP